MRLSTLARPALFGAALLVAAASLGGGEAQAAGCPAGWSLEQRGNSIFCERYLSVLCQPGARYRRNYMGGRRDRCVLGGNALNAFCNPGGSYQIRSRSDRCRYRMEPLPFL